MTDQHIFADFTDPGTELLLCCARTQLASAQAARIDTLLQDEIDWNRIIRLARLHHVAPLVYSQLNGRYRPHVPPSVMDELRHDFEIAERQNLFRTRALLMLIAGFQENGIAAIPYKGPVLAVLAYRNIGLRTFGDLDILIHKADVRRAKELLLAWGFRPALQLNDAQEALFLNSDYHHSFADAVGYVWVELHWAFWKKGLAFTPSQADVWRRAGATSLLNGTVMTFPPEDMIILSCIHGTKHLWHALGYICDVAELIRANPELDWEEVFARSQTLGAERMLFLGLHLAIDLLQAPLPEKAAQLLNHLSTMKSFAAQIESSILSEMCDETESARVGQILTFENYLSVLKTRHTRDRVRSFIWLAFTPNIDDYNLFPLPASLTVLYCGLHPARLAARYVWWRLTRRA